MVEQAWDDVVPRMIRPGRRLAPLLQEQPELEVGESQGG